MKRLFLITGLLSFSVTSFSQSQNWWKSDGTNNGSNSTFVGTSNNFALKFKSNNIEWFSISPSGIYKFNSLNGSTNGILGVNSSGELFRTNLTGNSTDVFRGDGTFGSISSLSGWFFDGNVIFSDGSKNIGIGTNIAPEKLTVNGNIIANGSISGTSINVVDIIGAGKEIKIQNSLCLKGIDANIPGSRNMICGMNGDLYVQSTNSNYNTILNYGNIGKVGIGVIPTEDFHVGFDSRFEKALFLPNLNINPQVTDILTIDENGNVLRSGGISEFAGSLYDLECWVDPSIGYVTPFWHHGAYKVFVGGNFCEQDIKVGINTANPATNLDVIGNAQISGTLKIGTSSIWLGGVDQATGSNNTIFSTTADLLIQSDAANSFNTILNANNTGNVGIGMTNPSNKLEVAGTVRACKFIAEANSWCDFVFADDYKLMSISEMEKYLKSEKHLKYLPSEKEIFEKGVDVVKVYTGLLRHTEENTLYIIQLEKEKVELEKRIVELEREKVETEEWKKNMVERMNKIEEK